MGRSLVKTALCRNDLVAAVGRTFENSPESMKKLEEEHENCLGLLCDVRARETVKKVIDRTIERFGRIDIVANCAGYGVIGACEDQDEYEIRDQFETNFTGTLNMIQLSLPHFRERRSGRYLIFSSTSGALGVPGLGPYCASKYAVEGLMESMLYEVDSFNIKGTLVEPGHMRRDDVGDLVSNTATMPSNEHNLASPLPLYGHFFVKQPSEPYNTPTAPAAHARRMLMWLGDKQPASAVKAPIWFGSWAIAPILHCDWSWGLTRSRASATDSSASTRRSRTGSISASLWAISRAPLLGKTSHQRRAGTNRIEKRPPDRAWFCPLRLSHISG